MKLTVLIDNNTLIDRYFIGEPGFSILIEEKDKKVIFDLGYSDAFIKNAAAMNINLYDLDTVVISHGHMDHTWGLFHLMEYYARAYIEGIAYKKPDLIAHPMAFNPKIVDRNEEIGSVLTADTLSRHFNMELNKAPIWITKRLVFLGEIERANSIENKNPIGEVYTGDAYIDDYLLDDTALAYKTDAGLVIITGCSHAGICNIIEYAKKICNDNRIVDVIGGFHLLNPEEKVLNYTGNFIKSNNVKRLHACHCTDLHSKIELSKYCCINEVGVGLILEY